MTDHPVLAKPPETQRFLDPLDIDDMSTLVTGKGVRG